MFPLNPKTFYLLFLCFAPGKAFGIMLNNCSQSCSLFQTVEQDVSCRIFPSWENPTCIHPFEACHSTTLSIGAEFVAIIVSTLRPFRHLLKKTYTLQLLPHMLLLPQP